MIQEERVRLAKSISVEQRHNALGFVVRTKSPSEALDDKVDKVDKSTFYCTNYKKMGHMTKYCFELIGYPEWWQNKSKTGGNSRGKYTQSSGKGRGSNRVNATAISNRQGGSTPSLIESSSFVFTVDQWNALTCIIGNTIISEDRLTDEFANHLWIINSGANRHLTCNDKWLFDIHLVSHCPVVLPNGITVMATEEGSIRLSPYLVLSHVLYVPEFNCNLISVSRLIDDSNYTVQFNLEACSPAPVAEADWNEC